MRRPALLAAPRGTYGAGRLRALPFVSLPLAAIFDFGLSQAQLVFQFLELDFARRNGPLLLRLNQAEKLNGQILRLLGLEALDVAFSPFHRCNLNRCWHLNRLRRERAGIISHRGAKTASGDCFGCLRAGGRSRIAARNGAPSGSEFVRPME